MTYKPEGSVSRKARILEVVIATAGAALTGGITSAAFMMFTAGGYVADLKTVKANQEQQANAIETLKTEESTQRAQLAATEAHYQEISSNLAQSRNETNTQLNLIRESLNDLNRRLR